MPAGGQGRSRDRSDWFWQDRHVLVAPACQAEPLVEGRTFRCLTPILAHCVPVLVGQCATDVLSVCTQGVRGVILAPTRELAMQIKRECDRLSVGLGLRAVVLSKANIAGAGAENAALPLVDIVITTPLRLASLVKSSPKALSTVTTLILDEADRLFEMGFVEQVRGKACGGVRAAACATPN